MFGRRSTATVPDDTVVDDRADTVIDADRTDSTVVAEPVDSQAVVAEPVAEEPVVKEPVVKEPVVEEPVAAEPAVEVRDKAAEKAAADKAAADQAAADQAVADKAAADRAATDEADKDADRDEADVIAERQAKRWAHVSLLASLSFFFGTLSLAATATGLLAPLGFAGGILAVLLGALASLGVRRRNVTGHGLVTFGILFGLIAIVISVLAMGGDLSWLSNKTDEVATAHHWLNDHFHWLRRW